MGHNDDERVSALLNHPRVHVGASDGGAHILSFSTYGDTGYLLGHFVREVRSIGLEAAIKKITSDTAAIWGIPERGQLQPGFVADITVFDAKLVDRGAEYYAADVPGDGSRYVRDSVGVNAVLVGGQLAWTAAGGYTSAIKSRNSGVGSFKPPARTFTREPRCGSGSGRYLPTTSFPIGKPCGRRSPQRL
jgi:N-acyl-D-aspartate/D-glutamate deacylase